jgi:hypothetical protein
LNCCILLFVDILVQQRIAMGFRHADRQVGQ